MDFVFERLRLKMQIMTSVHLTAGCSLESCGGTHHCNLDGLNSLVESIDSKFLLIFTANIRLNKSQYQEIYNRYCLDFQERLGYTVLAYESDGAISTYPFDEASQLIFLDPFEVCSPVVIIPKKNLAGVTLSQNLDERIIFWELIAKFVYVDNIEGYLLVPSSPLPQYYPTVIALNPYEYHQTQRRVLSLFAKKTMQKDPLFVTNVIMPIWGIAYQQTNRQRLLEGMERFLRFVPVGSRRRSVLLKFVRVLGIKI